jgi:hypothetical protein
MHRADGDGFLYAMGHDRGLQAGGGGPLCRRVLCWQEVLDEGVVEGDIFRVEERADGRMEGLVDGAGVRHVGGV